VIEKRSIGLGDIQRYRRNRIYKELPIILSVMILDFFGTFFSSANTLLPLWLRISCMLGRSNMAGCLPPNPLVPCLWDCTFPKNEPPPSGHVDFVSVGMFGLATILLASTSFWLTMLALILIGAFDGLSNIIRNTVRQILTPDAMRGRMMSITHIFFKGASTR
jgi:hypothetical protein